MNSRIKVMTIFGTRPEAIKMAPLVKELEKHEDKIESIVCVTCLLYTSCPTPTRA